MLRDEDRRSCADIQKLKNLSEGCKTKSDYVKFLNENTLDNVRFIETKDGIELHLGKKCCSCPMYPLVASPALCNCSIGNSEATWSKFFVETVKCEILESHLHGGNDCVLKLFI